MPITMRLARYELAFYAIMLLLLLRREEWQLSLLVVSCLGLVYLAYRYFTIPFEKPDDSDEGLTFLSAVGRGFCVGGAGLIIIGCLFNLIEGEHDLISQLSYVAVFVWWICAVAFYYATKVTARARQIEKTIRELGDIIGNLNCLPRQNEETAEQHGHRFLEDGPWTTLDRTDSKAAGKLYWRLKRLCD